MQRAPFAIVRIPTRLCALALLLGVNVVAASAQAPPFATAQGPRAGAVRLGYILPDSTDRAQRGFDLGARMGFAEAAHAATLLRRELVVNELDLAMLVGSRQDAAMLPSSATALVDAAPEVVIAPELSDAVAAGLRPWAAQPGRAIVTARASAGALCSLPVFRTGPDSVSRRSLAGRDPLASGGTSNSGADVTDAQATVELWHHELERFGARQLSDRYMQRYGTPMTSDAWEGWMAVKMAWESALRARDGNVALALANSAFDGHKGAALRFGAGDRVLRQPVVVVVHRRERDNDRHDGHADAVRRTAVLRELPWPLEQGDTALATFDARSCPAVPPR